LTDKNSIKKIHIIVALILIVLISNYFIQVEPNNEVEADNSVDDVGVQVAYLNQYENVIPVLRKGGFTVEATSYTDRAQKIATLPENGGEAIMDQSLFFMIYVFTLIVLSLAFYLHVTRRKKIL
jgi:hypothetical protein